MCPANLGAGGDGVRVMDETALVIAAALRASSASDGRFDPAVGAASELWDVLNRHEPPAEDRVHRLAARGFWRKVDVSGSGDASRVRVNDPDLHPDLGAIAQGYAVHRTPDPFRAPRLKPPLLTAARAPLALGHAP